MIDFSDSQNNLPHALRQTSRHSPKKRSSRLELNQRRDRLSLGQALRMANHRAHEQANRRMGKRKTRSVQASIASSAPMDEEEAVVFPLRLLRWCLALALLPVAWVTGWTFLSQFFQATVQQGFWQSAEFWYFATGVVWMAGMFWARIFTAPLLYLYVLGHELTHALFVLLFRGKVTDFHVSLDGGYITTNKTNLVIALSPYFVPFWTACCVLLYLPFAHGFDLARGWNYALFAVIGGSSAFHFIWTLWMIPRDQPDLRENGILLSLVVIFLANLLVLVGLLCLASDAPWHSFREFSREWLRHAATWGDAVFRSAKAAFDGLYPRIFPS